MNLFFDKPPHKSGISQKLFYPVHILGFRNISVFAIKWIKVKVQSLSPPAGERGGSVVECRTPEREVGGSIPTAAVLVLEQDTLLPESTG